MRLRWITTLYKHLPSLVLGLVLLLHLLLLSAPFATVGEVLEDLQWHLGLLAWLAAAWLCSKQWRKSALLLAGIAALDMTPEWLLYLPSRSRGEAEHSLVVVTANLLMSNQQTDAVAAALAECDADLIAVQELALPMRLALEVKLSHLPYRAFSPAGAWRPGTMGIALFSRLELSATKLPYLEGCYAHAIEAHCATPIGPVRVRAVHLPRPGFAWRCANRRHAIASLKALDWNRSDILLGDLNLTSTSSLFGDVLEATSLRDTRDGFGRQTSYWRSPFLPGTLGVAIDHILIGSQFQNLDRRIVRIPGLDHAAVRAVITTAAPSGVAFADLRDA